MVENTFPYSDKIHDYSSISNKLFNVTTVFAPNINIVLLFFTRHLPFLFL